MKMQFTKLLIPFFALIGISACNGQPMRLPEKPEIHWMSFEQAVAQNQVAPKKIYIDTYTAWCGWCKRMDATTFQDTAVIHYVNDHYYAVKLDAETKDTIHFDGKIFVYKPESKANELALALLNGKMSYPTTIFLDEKFGMLSPVPGFQTTEQLMPILYFFGENYYKNMKWDEYQTYLQKQNGGAGGAK